VSYTNEANFLSKDAAFLAMMVVFAFEVQKRSHSQAITDIMSAQRYL